VGKVRDDPPLVILFNCSSSPLMVLTFDIFNSSNFLLISSRAELESLPIFRFFNSSSENLNGFIKDFPSRLDCY